MKSECRSGCRGFSILEVFIAVAVLGVLGALSINPMSRYLKRTEFNSAVNNVKHLLQTCQSRAMANPNVHVGVYFDANLGKAVPFQDKANLSLYQYDPTGDLPYLQAAILKRGVRFERLAGYPNEIVFRGDGSAYKSLKIVLTDDVLKDTLDVLASTGRVRVGR